MEGLSTEELMGMIEASPKQFEKQNIQKLKNPQFGSYLGKLMEKYHMDAAAMVTKTCLSRTFFYQVLSGSRKPGRDTVLKLALAMGASVDETQRLLTLGGRNILYPRIRRDAAILCCIMQNKKLDVVNQFLEELGEEALL